MPVLSPSEEDWTRKQERLTRLSSALTGVGAASLGTMLAAKTKAGKKILPKKVHRKLNTARADDVRNTIALASLATGAVSSHKWANKMKRDVQVAEAVNSGQVTPEMVKEVADAHHSGVAKALIPSSIVRYPSGISRMRGASYRRRLMPRPRRRF